MNPMQNKEMEAEELTATEVAEAPEAEENEESGETPRTAFQKRVAGWSEKKWKWISGVCGMLLGFAVIFFLHGGNEDEGFSMFSMYAVVLALFVPRTLQSTCGRSVSFGQIMMIVAMTAGILIQLAAALMKG